MLDVVSKNSDFVIITSDNPRNETFDEITKDMLSNLVMMRLKDILLLKTENKQ